MLFCNSHLKSRAPLLSLKTRKLMVCQPTAEFMYPKFKCGSRPESVTVKSCPVCHCQVWADFESSVTHLLGMAENN